MELKNDYHRYEDHICQLKTRPKRTGEILFYGSSFFSHWGVDRCQQQLLSATDGRLSVTNHGFGGAVVDELLYNYPRLVQPYAPGAVVIRSGYNEINGGQSPRDSVFLLKRLIDWIHADFPGIPVVILKAFHCKRDSEAAHEKMMEYNCRLDAVFSDTENVTVLDITPFFYKKPEDIGDRSKLRDVFVPDGLHLNDTGYAEMANYLGTLLLQILPGK